MFSKKLFPSNFNFLLYLKERKKKNSDDAFRAELLQKKKSETVYNQEKVLTVYKKLDKHKYIYVF